jgi:hypothetical protein
VLLSDDDEDDDSSEDFERKILTIIVQNLQGTGHDDTAHRKN